MKNKVIVVVGPTAVGKTKISIELAKYLNIDVISGDSIAIYKGLDIGSAKPSISEMDGIKHHLIDIKEPGEDYSVADFQKDARDIIDKNELNLICGGTGLYIQSVIFDYQFEAKKRDDSLKEKYCDLSNEDLFKILLEKDPNIDLNKIHPNNRKRVLRALEVLEDTGNSIHNYNQKDIALYDYFIVYLSLDRETLYERINKRVDMMIDAGLVNEVISLFKKGIFPKGIGYREFIPYYNNLISLETAINEVKKNSRHLAKRQETWFKNQLSSNFYIVDLNNIDNTINVIKNDIDEWLKK